MVGSGRGDLSKVRGGKIPRKRHESDGRVRETTVEENKGEMVNEGRPKSVQLNREAGGKNRGEMVNEGGPKSVRMNREAGGSPAAR